MRVHSIEVDEYRGQKNLTISPFGREMVIRMKLTTVPSHVFQPFTNVANHPASLLMFEALHSLARPATLRSSSSLTLE